jgi:hypothetical protein
VELAAMVKRKRKVGRPKKKPGEPVDHRLTPKMRVAILAMVEDGKTAEEAAEIAGLTRDAINRSMRRNSTAREFYASELRALLNCTKHLAAHALIKELTGDNAAARVAAARTLLAEDEKKAPSAGMPQMPGFSFLVIDARQATGQPLTMANGHAPMITVHAEAEEVEPVER